MQGEEPPLPLITFDTTHHALWAEEVAREAGIAHEIVPAPPAANARCNLALEILEADVEGMTALLTAEEIPHGQYSEH